MTKSAIAVPVAMLAAIDALSSRCVESRSEVRERRSGGSGRAPRLRHRVDEGTRHTLTDPAPTARSARATRYGPDLEMEFAPDGIAFDEAGDRELPGPLAPDLPRAAPG